MVGLMGTCITLLIQMSRVLWRLRDQYFLLVLVGVEVVVWNLLALQMSYRWTLLVHSHLCLTGTLVVVDWLPMNIALRIV